MSEKKFKTMEEFTETVSTEFEKRIDKRVMLQKINKNNGVVWYGLTVLEDHFNVSPTRTEKVDRILENRWISEKLSPYYRGTAWNWHALWRVYSTDMG